MDTQLILEVVGTLFGLISTIVFIVLLLQIRGKVGQGLSAVALGSLCLTAGFVSLALSTHTKEIGLLTPIHDYHLAFFAAASIFLLFAALFLMTLTKNE